MEALQMKEHQWRSNLPDDVLIEILSRLPIKTLISFKCVSKWWLNLISADTVFADLHLKRSPTELLLLSSTDLYLGNHNDPVLDFKPNLLFHLNITNLFSSGCLDPKLRPKPVFGNSCNGFMLVRFSGVRRNSMPAVICNLFTGEFVTVPVSQLDNIAGSILAYGLGFSGRENRYKLLRLVYTKGGENPSSGIKVCAEICTFEKGSTWRNLGECPVNDILSSYTPLVFLEGKLHFHYFRLDREASPIDCFDLDNERFGKVPLPSSWDDHSCINSAVAGKIKLAGELESCLCISLHRKHGCFEVWVMKKYGIVDSWTKLVRVKVVDLFSPLVELGGGEILMDGRDDGLVLYNPVLNTTTSLGCGSASYRQVIAYNPSLVRLEDAFAGYEACVRNLNSR